MCRRRRQVRAAGTTNRLVDKDPRFQPSVSSRQSRKDRGLHSGTPVGSATPCHLPPSTCLHTAGQGLLPLPLHCNHWRGSRKCPEWRSLCRPRELHKLREEFPSELSSSAPDTRHALFERRPRQPEAELVSNQHRTMGESRSSKPASFNELAHILCHGSNASIPSSVQTRTASS